MTLVVNIVVISCFLVYTVGHVSFIVEHATSTTHTVMLGSLSAVSIQVQKCSNVFLGITWSLTV